MAHSEDLIRFHGQKTNHKRRLEPLFARCAMPILYVQNRQFIRFAAQAADLIALWRDYEQA